MGQHISDAADEKGLAYLVSCVQQILGHSSIKTIQIYIHVAAKKQAEILQNKYPKNKMRIINGA